METHVYQFTFNIIPNDGTWSWEGGTDMNIIVAAPSVKEAVPMFCEALANRFSPLSISKSAMAARRTLHRDRNGEEVQVGYVFTAGTYIQFPHNPWAKKYAEVWAEVNELVNPFNR